MAPHTAAAAAVEGAAAAEGLKPLEGPEDVLEVA